jgi:chromosome segregation ATPase
MQQIKHMSSISRTAEQQHSNKVAALTKQLQEAVERVQALEADLASTRLAMRCKVPAGQRSQQQKGSLDGGEGDADDQQHEVHQQGAAIARQAVSAAKSEDSCGGCKGADVQIADLTELLQQAQSNVAALEAELAAARQQAGQACGSAVFARQQVKTLSGQLQEAVEKIVQLENEAAAAKQQAAQAANELQALRDVAAAAAAAHAASTEAAEVERQNGNASVDEERALLRQQLEHERSNGLQLQAQLTAATEKVTFFGVCATGRTQHDIVCQAITNVCCYQCGQ